MPQLNKSCSYQEWRREWPCETTATGIYNDASGANSSEANRLER